MSDSHAMTPAELRQVLRMGVSTFYKFQAMGRFDAFELLPRIGPHRYSRKAVQAYLDREGAPLTLTRRTSTAQRRTG